MTIKTTLLFTLLLVNSTFFSQNLRMQILDFAKQNSKDGYFILTSVGKFKFEKYCSSEQTKSITSDFATIVHESCHTLNFDIGFSQKEYNEAYYVKDNIFIFTFKNNVFQSEKINKIVPEELRKKIYRYDTYINGKNISANVSGIYGLLDEYSAYYQSLKVRNDLYNYYFTEICKGYHNVDEWQNYFSKTSEYTVPYYEFKLFIAWYLIYAQKFEPTIYNQLLQNKNLRVAYTLIEQCFKQSIEQYNQNLNKTIEQLQKNGYKVKIDGEDEKYFYSYDDYGSSGVGLFIEEQEFLNQQIQQPEIQNILEEFKIQGVNISNYKSFLE